MGGAMIKDILKPDDIAAILSYPFITSYWPLLLGGSFVFLSLIKGYYWLAISLAALTVALQAWHSGALA